MLARRKRIFNSRDKELAMSAHFSRRNAVFFTLLLTLLAGCGRDAGKDGRDGSANVKVAPDNGDSGAAGGAASDPTLVPFAKAVLLEPPDGANRPPDKTAGGKATVKVLEQIAGRDNKGGLWNEVRLTGADGKPLRPHALVKTDAGDFKIELLADAAPNHVRSFIALAKAGYFDGLPFHASIRREGFAYLESGCPKGTGEPGYGSIGYWLKPEIQKELTHEEGTVGAWHAEELESAACRFYVTLTKNPGMDGAFTIFGKIVQGLDVAHTINKRPVQDDQYDGPPQEPHRIRQVVIVDNPSS
jgi:peptidyl-prolyl cis-trans isomerase B (cyclophilin B)